jgi:hypothetical protein
VIERENKFHPHRLMLLLCGCDKFNSRSSQNWIFEA